MKEYVKMFEVREVSRRKATHFGSEWDVIKTRRGTALKIVIDHEQYMRKTDDEYRDQFELMGYNVGIFVRIIKWGFKPRPWVETEWLDTDRVLCDFDSMFAALSDETDDYGAQERVYDMFTWPEEERDPGVYASVIAAMESAGFADLFSKYYDMSVECHGITGKKILDLHEGNWGYDSAGELKIFDY